MTAPQHIVTPPGRIAALRRNPAGYPIPFFVADQSSANPDFRVAGRPQFAAAVRAARCWVCGNPRRDGADAFTIGPMCAVNRVSADPPSHLECAEYSVRVCPVLLRPEMRRREAGLPPLAETTAGIALARNPGVSLIWVSRWRLTRLPNGWIFDLEDPASVSWWARGREATRAEVLAAIDSGMPELRKLCEGPDDHTDLDSAYQVALDLLPA